MSGAIIERCRLIARQISPAPGRDPVLFGSGRAKEASDAAATSSPAGWQVLLVEDQPEALIKRPGLSGPIQDAYYEPFVVVVPDTEAGLEAQAWQQAAHLSMEWTDRLVYKNPRTVQAGKLNAEMIASRNLICFGTPRTNSFLRTIQDALPVTWSDSGLLVEGQPARKDLAALIMIYPNPVNPARYVVVCSGDPQAVTELARGILTPPQLTRAPVEDLVVGTRDRKLPLWTRVPASQPGPGAFHSMADPPPPRGAVFDRNWRLPENVKAALLGQ